MSLHLHAYKVPLFTGNEVLLPKILINKENKRRMFSSPRFLKLTPGHSSSTSNRIAALYGFFNVVLDPILLKQLYLLKQGETSVSQLVSRISEDFRNTQVLSITFI